jgi:alpha-galactosidase
VDRVFLPPELMGTHVGPTASHSTGRTHDLSFRVATALFGHFGIEWDISKATPECQAGLADAVAFYKGVRDLLHSGTVVRVDYPDTAAQAHGVVAADGGEALFCYAQLATSATAIPARLCLPGLDPDRRYRIEIVSPAGEARTVQRGHAGWTKRGSVELPGSALTEMGVELPVLGPEQALLLRLKAVAAAAE